MAYDPNIRCVRLCTHGKDCKHQRCGFAHSLAELRAPNETARLYPEVWDKGVDRWHGQPLNEEQIRTFHKYYAETRERHVSQWVRALRYCISGNFDFTERHYCWDYGLGKDCELLCMQRRDGRLPFSFQKGVWDLLEARKHKLIREADKRTRRDAAP